MPKGWMIKSATKSRYGHGTIRVEGTNFEPANGAESFAWHIHASEITRDSLFYFAEDCSFDTYAADRIVRVLGVSVPSAWSYANQAFDKAQELASVLNARDRDAGRESSRYGYTKRSVTIAERILNALQAPTDAQRSND